MEHSKKLIALTLTAMVLTGFCIAPVAATSSPNLASTSLVIPFVYISVETGIYIASVLGLVAVEEALNHRVNVHENLQKVSEEFTSWLSALSGWIRADNNKAQLLFKIDNAFYNS